MEENDNGMELIDMKWHVRNNISFGKSQISQLGVPQWLLSHAPVSIFRSMQSNQLIHAWLTAGGFILCYPGWFKLFVSQKVPMVHSRAI